MVLDDRRIKVREIAEVMNMSKKRVLSHIKSTFRHEKVVRALGAAFAHVRPKMCSNEHFQRSVGAV
jgi:predicted DNA-binding transcriptional regulator